jgi:hypothetical protein
LERRVETLDEQLEKDKPLAKESKCQSEELHCMLPAATSTAETLPQKQSPQLKLSHHVVTNKHTYLNRKGYSYQNHE